MSESIAIVMAVTTTVAIGALGLVLGAIAKQLENIAWQIGRIAQMLYLYLPSKAEAAEAEEYEE